MKNLILSITAIFITTYSFTQTETGSFIFEGRTREYLVFLPQNYNANMPVVFNLHGYPDVAQWQMQYSLMNEVADTAGFIVVYPDAVPPGFYTGYYQPGWPPIQKINDVGFISALIDTLKADYAIDLSRVYSCGYSNGACMTLKLAGHLGYRFAACASVAGVMIDSIANEIIHMTPLPMLFCNGTGDNIVQYNGNPELKRWSVEQTINLFTQINGCIPEPDTAILPDLVLADGSKVQKISYTDCSDKNYIIFYKVINGGHSWPGGNPDITWDSEGFKNYDININAEMWNFFKNYQNPRINMAYAKRLEIDRAYISPAGNDTLNFLVELSNPQNHDVTVIAYIKDPENTFLDSIQSYDDGQHGDYEIADNIFGNSRVLTGLSETLYEVQTLVIDSNEETTQYLYPKSFLTTIGPVVFDDIVFDTKDTVPNPDDLMKIYIRLRNNGTTMTARNISAKLISLDPLIKVTSEENDYPDIPVGETVICPNYSRLNISGDCPENTKMPFALMISSDDFVFWRDTFNILIEAPNKINDISELRVRIFPNPGSGLLNIEFDAAESNNISIKLFNASGKVVYSEHPDQTRSPLYTIDLSNFKEGIYFIKISTSNYTIVKQLVRIE